MVRGAMRGRSPLERFEANIEKTATCWLWTAGLRGRRYGGFQVDGKGVMVHRWAYEFFVGPIPEDKQIDHICGVTRCVNPEHLRPLEPYENVRAYWREQRDTCRNGHDMTDPANVVWRLGGTTRRCRICERERMRRYRMKITEATLERPQVLPVQLVD